MVHHVTQNILFHTFHHVINDDGRVVLRLQDGLFSPEDTQAVIDKIKSIANQIIYTDPPLHLYATDLPNYTSINGVPLKNWSLQGKYNDVFPTVPDSFRIRSNNTNPYMFPVTHVDESYYSLVSDGFVPGGLENPDLFLKNFFKSSTNSFLCLAKMRHFTAELSSAILDNMNIRRGVKHSGISVGSVIDKDEELFFRQADKFLRAYQYASSTYDFTHTINSPVPPDINPSSLISGTFFSDLKLMREAFLRGIPTMACASLMDTNKGTLDRLAKSVEVSGINTLEMVFLSKLAVFNLRGYGSYAKAKELYDTWYLAEDNPLKPIGGGYLVLEKMSDTYYVHWLSNEG